MLFEIKHRFTGDVLFKLETESLKLCVEAAVKLGADLGGADLRYADLGGADLGIKAAAPEQAIQNLDKVREIILEANELLYMNHWHQDEEWVNRTCAEEVACGTTHCLAGWLQVCSTDKDIRALPPVSAGVALAPVAAKMFYETNERVLKWLRNREYAD